LIYLIPA